MSGIINTKQKFNNSTWITTNNTEKIKPFNIFQYILILTMEK